MASVDDAGRGETVIEMAAKGDEFAGIGDIGSGEFAVAGSRRAG